MKKFNFLDVFWNGKILKLNVYLVKQLWNLLRLPKAKSTV